MSRTRSSRVLPAEGAEPAALVAAMRYSVLARRQAAAAAPLPRGRRVLRGRNACPRTPSRRPRRSSFFTRIRSSTTTCRAWTTMRCAAGRPTCHVVFGEATALLAGDALQTLGFELLATRPAGEARAARRAARGRADGARRSASRAWPAGRRSTSRPTGRRDSRGGARVAPPTHPCLEDGPAHPAVRSSSEPSTRARTRPALARRPLRGRARPPLPDRRRPPRRHADLGDARQDRRKGLRPGEAHVSRGLRPRGRVSASATSRSPRRGEAAGELEGAAGLSPGSRCSRPAATAEGVREA